VSEYQYYKFLAIDKPLTDAQRAELRKLSSRAEITSTGFTNEHSFGDFQGQPEKLMERYFGAFLYLANWGTRRLMFRLPRTLLDASHWPVVTTGCPSSLTQQPTARQPGVAT